VWEGEKWKQKQKLINSRGWGRNQNVGTRFDERHDNWMGWIPLIQRFAVTPDTVPKVFNLQRLATSVHPRRLWMRPMLLFFLFIIDPNLLLRHFLSEFLPLFLGISILSVFPCHGGLQPPFTTFTLLPISTLSGFRFAMLWGIALATWSYPSS
jgi:hypothetical protein